MTAADRGNVTTLLARQGDIPIPALTRTLRIEVARGPQSQDPDLARYQVDGISGATRTGAGVTNLLRFWLGPDGFGPYLARLRAEAGAS